MSDIERAAKVDWIAYAKRGRARKFSDRSPWFMKCPDCKAVYVGSRTEKASGGICPSCQLRRDVPGPNRPRLPKGKVRETGKTRKSAATCAALAGEECPNRSDRGCLGTALIFQPELFGVAGADAEPLPRCLLLLKLPCRFFERHALPLTERYEGYEKAGIDYGYNLVGWQQRLSELPEADREKLAGHPFLSEASRRQTSTPEQNAPKCADCKGPRPPGKHYCDACRAKRRRASLRREKQRQRAG